MKPSHLSTFAGAWIGVVSACAVAAAAQPGDSPAPAPVRPGLPGSVQSELGIDRAPPLVREGAFVSSARGVLVRGKSGRWFFVFDRDARGRQLPPMVVLQSEHLSAMERLASRMEDEELRTAGARMLVTGQVLAYAGHNYLLPSAPPLVDAPPPPQPEPPQPEPAAPTTDAAAAKEQDSKPAEPPQAEDAAASPAQDAGDEPTIEQIVGELDRAIGARRAANPARTMTDAPAATTESGTPRLRPAGVLTPRRGRFVRSASGEPMFIMDSGAADGGVAEPPMVLLPCANLGAIESIAERIGESATFTMSGQVHVYKDRNYLLPTMYTVNRVQDQVIPNQ